MPPHIQGNAQDFRTAWAGFRASGGKCAVSCCLSSLFSQLLLARKSSPFPFSPAEEEEGACSLEPRHVQAGGAQSDVRPLQGAGVTSLPVQWSGGALGLCTRVETSHPSFGSRASQEVSPVVSVASASPSFPESSSTSSATLLSHREGPELRDQFGCGGEKGVVWNTGPHVRTVPLVMAARA